MVRFVVTEISNPSAATKEATSLKEMERKLVDIERSVRKLKRSLSKLEMENLRMKEELERDVHERCRGPHPGSPKECTDEGRGRFLEELSRKVGELVDEFWRLKRERAFIRFVLTLVKECQGWGVTAAWYHWLDEKIYFVAAPATIAVKFKNRRLLIDGISYGLEEGGYAKRSRGLGEGLHHWVLDVYGLRIDVVLCSRRKRHAVMVFLANRDVKVEALAEAVGRIVEEEEERCARELGCGKRSDEAGSTAIECGDNRRYRNFIKCSLKRAVDRISSEVASTFPPP